MGHDWRCGDCGDSHCSGCGEESEEARDPQELSLEQTPDALGLFPDGRDATKPPPVFLGPRSIIRNRERTRCMLATGEFTWPRPQAA